MTQWIKQLAILGDPIEREGFTFFNLGKLFPNYAKFWSIYVLPNRSTNDPSKLKSGFPPQVEDILNAHYYIFYQLVISGRQIANLSNPLVDVSTPFYHLATCVDIVERLFVLASNGQKKTDTKDVGAWRAMSKKNHIYLNSFLHKLKVEKHNSDKRGTKLSQSDFDKKVENFWNGSYTNQFKKFKKSFRPVSLNFHNLTDIFNQRVPKNKSKKNFNRVANKIRRYRNLLTHSIAPLKIISENREVQLPIPKHLSVYKNARWSSESATINPEHYLPISQTLNELWLSLVNSLNELWEMTLLVWMEDIKTNYLEEEMVSSEKIDWDILHSIGNIYASGISIEPPISGTASISRNENEQGL